MTARRRRIAGGPLAAGVLLTAAMIWAIGSLVFDASLGSTLAAAALGIGLVLVAAASCWRAAQVSPTDATGWRLMAAALLVFAVSVAMFTASEIFSLSDLWLTAAAVVGLVFRIVAAMAMVSFPIPATSPRSRWRARLDLTVVAATVSYLAWGWLLSGLFHDAHHSAPAARAAMFSLLDIILVIIVLMASLRRPAGVRDSARLVGAGLLCLAVADWDAGVTLATGSTSASPLASLAMLVAVSFIAWGAWLAGQRTGVQRRRLLNARRRDLLPVLLAAIALAATIATGHPWIGDPLLIVLATTSAASLLAWQVAVVLENEEMMQSLSEERERFQTVVETAPIAIIETDARGLVQVINSEATKILGQEATDLIGVQLQIHPIDAQHGERTLRQRLLDGETIRDLRLPVRRPDGVELELMVSGAPSANWAGEVTRVVWIGSDDGPRMRGLAAMIDVQRMQAFEQLTSGIAHDFNNRLTVILGTTEILLDQASTADEREMLEAVLSAGQRAASLVDQLVSSSRRKSDDQERLGLDELLEQLRPDLVRRAPRGASLQIEVDLDDGPLLVQADWSDVEQAVINLVVNAFEALDTGGSVVVRALRVPPPTDGERGLMGPKLVELVVTDDGRGMDPVTQARIFEPFFTTKVGGGRSRGLGLPAVQGVVLRSQGELGVRSTPGEGTTVTVRLPLCEPAPSVVAPVPTVALHGAAPSTATILLVDDEPEVRAVARRVLSEAGYAVIEAAGADEALAIARTSTTGIDLLLSDVVMPGRSGLELANDFAEVHPDRPVLLLSGFIGETTHGGRATDLPFPLLAKPISREDLLAAVADALLAPV